MRIAVYSGSFNPLHIGHLAIMKYLKNECSFDCVYLVVSPKNPLKDTVEAQTGQKRFNDAVEAVNRHPEINVRVDDIELGMEPPHYTVRTLEALKQREPENEFTLVVGADNLDSFNKWKDYGRILREFGIAVYPRKGYDIAKIRDRYLSEDPGYLIEIIDAPLVDISSSQIRQAQDEGLDVSGFLM